MTALPPDISLAFAPSAQTLWAVWGKSSEEQVATGWRAPVYQVWLLASAGEQGLAEIRGRMPTQFLAAAPFEHIQGAGQLFDTVKRVSWWPSWLPGGSKEDFFLLEEGGRTRWGFGDAGQQDRALLKGGVKDFEALSQEGQQILEGLRYDKILLDTRPVIQGHPIDWLEMMKSPHTWGPIRHLIVDQANG